MAIYSLTGTTNPCEHCDTYHAKGGRCYNIDYERFSSSATTKSPIRSAEYKEKALRARARHAISNYKITKEKVLNEGLTHKGLRNLGKKAWPYVLDILGVLEDSGHDLWKYSKQELIREVLRLKAQIKDEV